MSAPLMAAMDRLWRRVQLVVTRGRVKTGSDAGPVQMLQLKIGALEVRDNLPRVAEYGFTSMPKPNCDAIVIYVGGDRSNGVIVGTNDQAARLRNLQPGEVAVYDDQGQSVYLTRAGIVVNGAGLPITINNTPSVTVAASTDVVLDTPILKVSGDIIDNAGSNTHTMAQMRAIYNEHNHLVTGVQRGSSSVTSDPPGQTE